jgi:hypothetical protein
MTDQSTSATAPHKHLTTSQALAKYDATQRAAAIRAGMPTPRTAMSGFHQGKDGKLVNVIYTGLDGKVYILDLRDDFNVPDRATFDTVRKTLSDAYDLGPAEVKVHNIALFADTDTLRRVAKMADIWGREKQTQEAKCLSRLMAFRKGLPTSVYTPVLTEALATRYWLPTGPDLDDVTAWAAAFGQRHTPHSRESFMALAARALEGIINDKDTFGFISPAEKYGARSGQWGSDFAAASAYTKAGTIADAWTALLSLDPNLRERNAIAGTVSKIRIHQIKDNKIEAYMDDPGRLSEGKEVLLFDGFTHGEKVKLTLRSVDYVNGALMATLSSPGRSNKGAYLIEEAHKNYKPLYVVAKPFLVTKPGPKNRKWTNSGDEKVLHVDIPVDIALAGGPTED